MGEINYTCIVLDRLLLPSQLVKTLVVILVLCLCFADFMFCDVTQL